MPLSSYGVLRATPVDSGREDNDLQSPHFQIIAEAAGFRWRIPVNVRSSKNQSSDPNRPDKSLVIFRIEDPMPRSLILDQLDALGPGFHLKTTPGPGLALDYQRAPLFDRTRMRILNFRGPGESDDIQDLLQLYASRAIGSGGQIFAFGELFDSTASPRPVDVTFNTQRGVHDIHMNQGNPSGSFAKDNGAFQDGGLILKITPDQWVGFFLAFQTQLLPTNNSGFPLPGAQPFMAETGGPGRFEPVPSGGAVRIIAALLNPPSNDKGSESVTLLNLSAQRMSLDGWRLLDKQRKTEPLSGVIEAGDARRIRLSGQGAELSNKGGVIILEDGAGSQIDSVSYTKADASNEGVTLAFSR